jgi:hypothetical protein
MGEQGGQTILVVEDDDTRLMPKQVLEGKWIHAAEAIKGLLWVSLLLSVWLPVAATQVGQSLSSPRPGEITRITISPSSFPPYSDPGEPLRALPAQDDRELFPIAVNGKIGYIDVNGRVVIKPRFKTSDWNGHYTDEQYFKEGLAIAYEEEDRGGFIDKTGKFVIVGPYYPRGHFSGGLARVSDHKNYDPYKVGFMDKTGKFVIRPQFNRPEDFSEGLAVVHINNKWGYIDQTGKMVIPARFDDAGSFHDGFALVNISAVRRGYINKAGKFLPMPDEVERFGSLVEGLIAVKVENKWGFMNTQGQIVIAPQFDPDEDNYREDVYFGVFFGELALVRLNGKWGYINRVGKFVIPPRFDKAKPFEGDIAAVSLNGKWGYINRSGEVVTPPTFDKVENFAEGFAAVSVGGKWGYVDHNGKLVIALQFTGAVNFSEGLAAAQVAVRRGQEDKYLWGYIDKSGKFVIEPQFISASAFYHGLAHQTIWKHLGIPSPSPGYHDEWGYINRAGKYVWKSTN